MGTLRENPDTEALPVISLTAMPATVGEVASPKMGVTHYLNKPWEPGVVEATLWVALREAGKTTSTQSREGVETARTRFSEVSIGNESGLESHGVNIMTDLSKQFGIQGNLAKLRSGKKRSQPSRTQKAMKQKLSPGETNSLLLIRTWGTDCPLAPPIWPLEPPLPARA